MTYPSQSRFCLIGAETFGSAGTVGSVFEIGGWLSGTGGTSTPNDVGMIITDITDSLTREVIESFGISRIQVQKITSGLTGAGITIAGDYQHGRLFKFIVGGENTEATSSDFTHTFGISQIPPAASIQSGNNLSTDTILKHVGQFIESAELSIALNQNLKLSTTWKGKSSYNPEGTAPTIISSTLPVFPHALCEVKINSIAATEIQNASITITKTVEISGGVGSNIPQQGWPVNLKFEFSASLGFVDATFQNLFMGGTAINANDDPAGFEFEINADNAIALGSGQRNITLILENCMQSSFNEPTSVGGLTFLDISGTGTLKTLTSVDNIAVL